MHERRYCDNCGYPVRRISFLDWPQSRAFYLVDTPTLIFSCPECGTRLNDQTTVSAGELDAYAHVWDAYVQAGGMVHVICPRAQQKAADA